MVKTCNTFSISSEAYRTSIVDEGLFKAILKKNNDHFKDKDSENNNEQEKRSTESNISECQHKSTGGVQQRTKNVDTETRSLWESKKKYVDTSNRYQRPYIHMGLWSRIRRNSGGSLPKEVDLIGTSEIADTDRLSVKSYVTGSRGIRKCCLTVFTRCAQSAARSIGLFKGTEKRPYSCQSAKLSVKTLAKNTHAGTDTLGKKNNTSVQERVLKQVIDIMKRPTSYKVIGKNPIRLDKSLFNMFDLPELVFHRFQAIYDEVTDRCLEKSRVVWCVPYTIVALENMFFGNLINSSKSKSLLSDESIYPIGLTNYQIGKKSVSSLRNKFKVIGKGRYNIYSLDFSKFDSSIPNWTKDLFFALVRPYIDMNERQSKVFDYLRVYIKHTPFVYKNNKLFHKMKGISSGLLITNLFDSWWNLTIHYFVHILKELYTENIDDIMDKEITFDKLYMDKSKVRNEMLMSEPLVRVMGDDSIILCDEFTLNLHRKVCLLLGMKVTIKHITKDPYDPIFFLGRYWDTQGRPYQTEEYMALRIVYTKWYKEEEIEFPRDDIHLNRMLSICLPLVGGEAFLNKYLFDYEPYMRFKKSGEGFVYMKDFIENTFRYVDKYHAFSVDNY